jgi:transposase InsO family protein
MRSEISDQLKECDACTRFTVVKTGYHPAQAITAVGPWDHIQIDTSVHLPESPDGFCALLVVIDVFTSFVILRPLRNTKAETVAESLWSIFCILGLPKIMQSDNGPEFSNDILRTLVTLTGIEQRFISPYHPQADGKVERSIGTTTMIIKKMLHGTTHHWPLFVNFAQLSFNQKISSLTGSAPFSLMFGRKCNDLRNYSSQSDEYTLINLEDWKEHQEKILSLIYPAISERIKGGKDKMIQSLNKSRKILLPSSLPEGSTVMLKDPVRANKFEPKYVGPYTIIRRARNGAYVLKDATGMILDRHVPLDQLKIVIKGPQRRKIDESSEVFEVESILAHRGNPGAHEYLVHWKGYSAEEDSWEPSSSFHDTRIIEKYWLRCREASSHQ